MRILIVNPRLAFDAHACHMRPGSLPSNVAVVAAALAPFTDSLEVFDFAASHRIELAGSRISYGRTDEEFITYLEENRPDAIGFPSPWTIHHHTVVETARLARRTLPGAVIFAGGHHVTVCRPMDEMDFIVTGELEPVAPKVASTITAHLAGDKSCRLIEGCSPLEMDRIPFPAYEKMDLAFYRAADREHQGSVLKGGVPITTSRGCPYKCHFCAVHLSMSRRWRACSPARILEQLRHLKNLGFSKFHFEDDNLTLSKSRWTEVMQGMLGCGYEWTAPNGLRLDSLDNAFLELAAASGCREMKVAIESTVDTVRNGIIDKALSIVNIDQVAAKCHELGITLGAFLMIGIPGERLDDMKRTIAFARRLKTEFKMRPILSVATPFPGTELTRQCEKNGWLTQEPTPERLQRSLGGRGLIQTPDFTPDQVTALRNELMDQEPAGVLTPSIVQAGERLMAETGRTNGRRIALYGAGQHTRNLLSWLAKQPQKNTPEIACILDDTPHTQSIRNIPVLPAKHLACPTDIKTIVISSDTFEDNIYQRATQLGWQIPIVRLYRSTTPGTTTQLAKCG